MIFSTQNCRKVAISGLAAVFFFGAILLYHAGQTHISYPKTALSDNSSRQYLITSVDESNSSSFASSVNLINFEQTAAETLSLEEKPFSCPTVRFSKVAFPMCLFPIHKDIFVSKTMQSGETYWESGKVGQIVRLLGRLRNSLDSHGRDVVFVDLGANIGTYSLPILHNGFKVVSVDAQWDAIRRLTLSVYLAANQTNTQKITILHNAVTNETGSLLTMNINPENAGGSNVVAMVESCSTRVCNKTSVRTITFNDLLPFVVNKSSAGLGRPQVVIKVDIEGSEPKVFTEKTAAKFFEETDVVAVQMEWIFPHDIRTRQALFTFFTRRGFSIHNAAAIHGQQVTLSELIQGGFTGDIILVKKGFDTLM